MADAPHLHPDRYRILDHIGAGGMADVYMAEDTVLGRRVVLKRLKDTLLSQPQFVTMFLDEARTVAKLNHPNIIGIFDIGRSTVDNGLFMAMEYLEGYDLRHICESCEEQDRVLDISVILRLLIETCAGLFAAHSARTPEGQHLNLVHRDISPQNIFVTVDGIVKILDFGIAKTSVRRSRTGAGKLRGKFAYMSPEQLEGNEVDFRSDIFSLGIVLHELLAGRQLFGGLSLSDTFNAIVREPIPPPIRVSEALPDDLVRITRRALERDPDRRFPTAQALGHALEGALHNWPTPPPNVAAYLAVLNARAESFEEDTTITSKNSLRRTTYAFGRLDIDEFDAADASGPPTDEVLPDMNALYPPQDVTVPHKVDAVASLYMAAQSTVRAAPRGPIRDPTLRLDVDEAMEQSGLVVRKPWKRRLAGSMALVVIALAALVWSDLQYGTLGNRIGPAIGPTLSQWLKGVRAAGNPAPSEAASESTRREQEKKPPATPPAVAPAASPPSVDGVVATSAPTPLGHVPGATETSVAAGSALKAPGGEQVDKVVRGWLSLFSEPGVYVYYKGEPLGATPLRRVQLASGTLELRLVNKDLAIDTTRVFIVPPGGHLERRLQLRRGRMNRPQPR